MNNHSMNNFMTAQTPVSSLLSNNNGNGNSNGDSSSNGQAAQPQQTTSGGDNASNNNGSSNPNVDPLQDVYNRTADRGSQHHPIAEFLYQLTKMLTDDNSEIIEWSDGRIKVHYPERLEGEVLHKYFRHSKFASFQRQLNYFGFRKIAGKGKMSPCSYVNEAATSDIRSLLLIKRKTNGSAARKAAMAQRNMVLPGGDLRANLSALAAGAAAATCNPQVNRLNSHAFSNAAAYLSDSQRAQLGAGFPLQQKSLGPGSLFLQNENAMHQLLMGQKQDGSHNFGQPGMPKTPSAPSIEQLHAQLAASLAGRGAGGMGMMMSQLSGGSLSQLGQAPNGMASANAAGGGNKQEGGPASAALNATAALQSMQDQQGGPATSAMNAASGNANVASLFDSATNLKSLVNEQGQGNNGMAAANSAAASQAMLNRLPSAGGLFPGNISSASFGNLLASSNRLSSLLSLNSFLSRDPSMADLMGVMPGQQQGQQPTGATAAAGLSNPNQFKFQ